MKYHAFGFVQFRIPRISYLLFLFRPRFAENRPSVTAQPTFGNLMLMNTAKAADKLEDRHPIYMLK